MNDKTKRIILITACCLLCGVAVIGIAGRFGGNTVTPSGTVSGSQPDSNDPNVNINNSQGDVNVPSLTPEQSDPGQGANSNGTEQTIQANPVKPDAPEKPESPSGTATLPDDHKAEDVPTSERKTEDEPQVNKQVLMSCGENRMTSSFSGVFHTPILPVSSTDVRAV